MKILLLNQFFWPDSAATSQLLTDLARGLAEGGNDVYVVCAEGGYAVTASDEAPPVHIHRVKALPFVRGRLGRILSYLSFYVSATFVGLTLPRQDLVVTLTTPPLLSLLGTIIKVSRGTRHFIWEMDVYPDVAIDLNYFKAGGVIDRVTGLLADYSRHHANGIIALGECMKRRLMQRGVPAENIFVADNWADGNSIIPLPRRGNPDKLVLLYSGNLGLAHDLDTIAAAVRDLRKDERFSFLFVGSGGRRDELGALCVKEDIHSVELRPYVQRSSLSESLSEGDIGLVTQRENCCGSVVPSKVYGLLAAGRPILFIGPREATPALIVERFACGWQVDCGDVTSLKSLLLYLADHPEDIKEAGRRARQTLLAHYDLPIGVARITTILESGSRISFSTESELSKTKSEHGSNVAASS
jgi:colanic acid biosynthesis glycosyl transferase WcaI